MFIFVSGSETKKRFKQQQKIIYDRFILIEIFRIQHNCVTNLMLIHFVCVCSIRFQIKFVGILKLQYLLCSQTVVETSVSFSNTQLILRVHGIKRAICFFDG